MALETLLAQEAVEDRGAWFPLPEEVGGEMLITYTGNPEFRKKLQRLVKIYRKQHALKESDELPDEAMEEISLKALVGTVAKAIRGVYEHVGDEAELESTEANISRLLGLRTVLTHVLGFAKERETFRAENLELIAKN